MKDWDNFPYLYELRAALERGEPWIDLDGFAQVVGSEWRMDDRPSRHTEEWLELLRYVRAALGRPLVDASNGDPLPDGDVLEAWRGVKSEDGARGMSWTLDREKAVSFANRCLTEGEIPHVFRTAIRRADVLAFFISRDEIEVIVDPADLGPLTEEAI